MASLDDLLTATKNIVTALNGINSTLGNVNSSLVKSLGTATSSTISAGSNTLVVSGSGRLINFIVLTAGSANGTVYDTTNTSSPPAADEMVVIPQTLGVFPIGAIFTNGLVVTPGTGQVITVTYYLG